MDALAALLELIVTKPGAWSWGRHVLTLGIWMTPVLMAGVIVVAAARH
jgi:hypothetical protein